LGAAHKIKEQNLIRYEKKGAWMLHLETVVAGLLEMCRQQDPDLLQQLQATDPTREGVRQSLVGPLADAVQEVKLYLMPNRSSTVYVEKKVPPTSRLVEVQLQEQIGAARGVLDVVLKKVRI
jgi:hypothetical protein